MERRGTEINDGFKVARRLSSFSKSVLNKKKPGQWRCGQMGSNEALREGKQNRKSMQDNQSWEI
jgi:hypothetical protein